MNLSLLNLLALNQVNSDSTTSSFLQKSILGTVGPLPLMLKAQLLCAPVPNRISEMEFWVKQKRLALLLCQAKGDTVGSFP